MQLDEALVPPDTAFMYHEEVKQTVGNKRVLKVYLVEKDGSKHLAATGEDLGDAHYHYRSTKPFSKYGAIDCHNRKELTQWLEMIISETSNKEGPHLDVDEQNPEGVYFTAHKYERAQMSDGRRVNRWFLVDQHGSAHLAVIGVERDTKDGHYTYGAEEPFASRIPLQCSNQSGVFKWLERWITHHAAGSRAAAGQANGQAASGTVSAGTATSGAGPSGIAAGTRNPPVFISLSAIRHARKSAAAVLAASATLADPQVRAKAKSKPAAEPDSASGLHEEHTASAKNKSLSMVQQNQVKKARKLQEDAKAEQERLVAGHLARLRRAAAAELQGDSAAKQVAMSWLQGDLTPDELEALQHWVTLLSAVLDLQQRQQWQQQGASRGSFEVQAQGLHVEGLEMQEQQLPPQELQQEQLLQQQKQGTQCDDPSPGSEPCAVEDQQILQLQHQHQILDQDQQAPQQRGESEVVQPQQASHQSPHKLPELQFCSRIADATQQQQQLSRQQQQHLQQLCSNGEDQMQRQLCAQSSTEQTQQHPKQQPQQQDSTTFVGAGMTDKELLTWLQQPGNERHYMRVTLECLKEIGAVELPARALLGHKVVALVRRCLAENADESVRSLAQHMLQRWRWQLAGHMQVLTQPAYMEDHLAVLDQQVAAGLVLLPQLPRHKQVLLSTDLTTISGVASGRMQHTSAHYANHYVHPQQQHQQAGHSLLQKQVEAGGQAEGALGFGSAQHHNSHAGLGSLPQRSGLGTLHPNPLGTVGFATPLAALSGLYRAGSPALAAALGAQQSLLHAAGGSMQSSLLSSGQQMPMFQYVDPGAVDALGLNHNATLLSWPLGSAGVPALGSVQLQAAGVAHPLQVLQQQQLQMHQSHFLGMPQQQLRMQQSGLAATAATAAALAAGGGLQMSSSLLQQPLLASQQVALERGQMLQQLQAGGQQQHWADFFLQQPLAAQQDLSGAKQQLVWQGGTEIGAACER